jgi:hypothetical protein
MCLLKIHDILEISNFIISIQFILIRARVKNGYSSSYCYIIPSTLRNIGNFTILKLCDTRKMLQLILISHVPMRIMVTGVLRTVMKEDQETCLMTMSTQEGKLECL